MIFSALHGSPLHCPLPATFFLPRLCHFFQAKERGVHVQPDRAKLQHAAPPAADRNTSAGDSTGLDWTGLLYCCDWLSSHGWFLNVHYYRLRRLFGVFCWWSPFVVGAVVLPLLLYRALVSRGFLTSYVCMYYHVACNSPLFSLFSLFPVRYGVDGLFSCLGNSRTDPLPFGLGTLSFRPVGLVSHVLCYTAVLYTLRSLPNKAVVRDVSHIFIRFIVLFACTCAAGRTTFTSCGPC